MLTRWGKTLNTDTPLPEYPRPQMRRDQWINLNGYWDYTLTTQPSPQPDHWTGQILVPFCIESPLSGVEQTITPQERIWYRRRFNLASIEERTLLHFGAVDFECMLWVNGGIAGTHTGGFDAFTIDISEYVRQGSNELILAVTDPSSSGDQPRGKQHLNPKNIWYHAVSGIWQTVWVEQVPTTAHLEEIYIAASATCDAIEFTSFLGSPTRNPELALAITITLGEQIVQRYTARPDRKVTIKIPQPQRWSPDNPVLYDIDITLMRIKNPIPAPKNDNLQDASLFRALPLRGNEETQLYENADLSEGTIIDRVSSYFALRHIDIDATQTNGIPAVRLNGEPIFQLGTLDQGWWPDGFHTPPADEAMIYEIEFLKAAGFNCVRKHIKVEPARYYYHCDRLGLLVWQDVPSGFLPAQFVGPNDAQEGVRSSRSSEQFGLEMHRMINRLRVHPCIIVWVLHNEGWGQFDSARLTQHIRDLDPTRLVNATSGWLDAGVGDFIDRHDYAATPVGPETMDNRARVIGEYGGIGWPISGHLWNADMHNWGYQTFRDEADARQAYQQVTQGIMRAFALQGLSGAIYTQTSDVEGEVNGLLTYDRAVEKFPRSWLKDQHQALLRESTDPEQPG